MGKEVELNGEVIDFPDSMPDEEVEAQLQKMYRQVAVMPKGNQQMATSEQFTGAPTKPAPGGPSTVGFIRNLGSKLYGVGDALGGYIQENAGKKPEDFIVGAAQDIGSTITPQNIGKAIEGRWNAYTGGNALGEIYNDPLSFLGDVAGAVDLAPRAGAAAAQTGRAAAQTAKTVGGAAATGAKAAAPYAWAATKGAMKDLPVIGPTTKSMATEMEKLYNARNTPVKPPPPNPNAGGRIGPRAPSLESELDKALRSQMEPTPAPQTTAPPAPTITTPGREGEFMSSGTPSVSASRYSEIEGAAPTPPPPVEPPAPPAGRLGGRAPNLEDELNKAMQELMEPSESAPAAAPVEPPPTPEQGITFSEAEKPAPAPAPAESGWVEEGDPGTQNWPAERERIPEAGMDPADVPFDQLDTGNTPKEGLSGADNLLKDIYGMREAGPVSADAPVTGDMLRETERRLMEQADREAFAQSNKPAIVKEAERAAELEQARPELPSAIGEPARVIEGAPPQMSRRGFFGKVGEAAKAAKTGMKIDELVDTYRRLRDGPPTKADIDMLTKKALEEHRAMGDVEGVDFDAVLDEDGLSQASELWMIEAEQDLAELGLDASKIDDMVMGEGKYGPASTEVRPELPDPNVKTVTAEIPPEAPPAAPPKQPKRGAANEKAAATRAKKKAAKKGRAPDYMRSTEKPEKWESGAAEGSPEAKRAKREHQEEYLADELYRLMTEDSTAAPRGVGPQKEWKKPPPYWDER